MTERVKGNLKWFSSVKGYGFIISNGVDYFFHISEKRDSDEISEGDEVEFEILKTEKGFSASNVTKIIGE